MSDAHAHAAPAKKGLGSQVWGLVGTAIVVLIGLTVLFWIIQAFVPGVFEAFNATLVSLTQGLTQAGVYLGLLATSVGVAASGGFKLFLIGALYFLLFLYGIYLIGKVVKNLRGGGDDHPKGH